MKIPARQLFALPVLAATACLAQGTLYYTGTAVTNINNMPQPAFAQTYALAGSPAIPVQFTIQSTYAGGINQMETIAFVQGGKIVDTFTDPATGQVTSTRNGTYVVSALATNNAFAGIEIAVNITGSTQASVTFKIFYATNDAGPMNQRSTNLKATFTSVGGGVTTVTVFNGDQIAAAAPPPSTAPVITSQPVAATGRKNRTVNFQVMAKGGQPLSYVWQKFRVNLKNGGHVSGAATATLTLTKVNQNCGGLYRVIVTNAAGRAVSREVMLTVK